MLGTVTISGEEPTSKVSTHYDTKYFCKSGKHCVGSACYETLGPKTELKTARNSFQLRTLHEMELTFVFLKTYSMDFIFKHLTKCYF